MPKIVAFYICFILSLGWAGSCGTLPLLHSLTYENHNTVLFDESPIRAGAPLFSDSTGDFDVMREVPSHLFNSYLLPVFYEDRTSEDMSYIRFTANKNLTLTLVVASGTSLNDTLWEYQKSGDSDFINHFSNGVDYYTCDVAESEVFSISGSRLLTGYDENYLLFVQEKDVFSVNINFGLSSPQVYLTDSGSVWGKRSCGLTYGWNYANWNIIENYYSDTPTIETSYIDNIKNNWCIELPSGQYRVKVYFDNLDSLTEKKIKINENKYTFSDYGENTGSEYLGRNIYEENSYFVIDDYLTVNHLDTNYLTISNCDDNTVRLYAVEIEKTTGIVDIIASGENEDDSTEPDETIQVPLNTGILSTENPIGVFRFDSLPDYSLAENIFFNFYIKEARNSIKDTVTLSLYAISQDFPDSTEFMSFATLNEQCQTTLVATETFIGIEEQYIAFPVKEFLESCDSERVTLVVHFSKNKVGNEFLYLTKDAEVNKPRLVVHNKRVDITLEGTISYSLLEQVAKLTTIEDKKTYTITGSHSELSLYDQVNVNLEGYLLPGENSVFGERITILAPSKVILTAPVWDTTGFPTWKWKADETAKRFKLTLDSDESFETTDKFYTPGTELTDGQYTLLVRSGNTDTVWSAAAKATVIVDREGPSIANVKLLKEDTKLKFFWESMDNFSNNDEVVFFYKLISGSVDTSTLPWKKCSSSSVRVTPLQSSDTTTFVVKAIDAAGNEGEPCIYTFSNETTSPFINNLKVTEGAVPVISWEISDNCPLENITVRYKVKNGKGVLTQGTEKGITSFTPSSDLAEGNYMFILTATDQAGNCSVKKKVQFTVDKDAPKIAITAPGFSKKLKASWVITDNSKRVTTTCTLKRGDTTVACTPVIKAKGKKGKIVVNDSVPDGKYTLTVTASDGRNRSIKHVTIIKDTQKPVIKNLELDMETGEYSWSSSDQNYSGNTITYKYCFGKKDREAKNFIETTDTVIACQGKKRLFVIATDRAGNRSKAGKSERFIKNKKCRIRVPGDAYDGVDEISMHGLNEGQTRSRSVSREGKKLSLLAKTAKNSDKIIGEVTQFEPEGTQFNGHIEVIMPYNDLNLTPEQEDVLTFYYLCESDSVWEEVDSVIVDRKAKVIKAYLTHFSIYAAGLQSISATPPQAKGINTATPQVEAADAQVGIREIAPPTPNNRGCAIINYPFNIPKAAVGPTPGLALTYNSEIKEDYEGYGWNLTQSTIQIDHRKGVHYGDKLTYLRDNTFLYNGQELTYERDEDEFRIINNPTIRIKFNLESGDIVVYHGDGSKEIYDKNIKAQYFTSILPENQKWVEDYSNEELLVSLIPDKKDYGSIDLKSGNYYFKNTVTLSGRIVGDVKIYANEVILEDGFEVIDGAKFETFPIDISVSGYSAQLEEFLRDYYKDNLSYKDIDAQIKCLEQRINSGYKWFLTENVDPSGNKVVYDYDEVRHGDGINYYPVKISYDFKNGGEADRSIELNWEPKERIGSNYQGQVNIVNAQRLKSVVTKYKSTSITSYEIENAKTNFWYTVINRIREYNHTEGYKLVNSHSFTYQDQSTKWHQIGSEEECEPLNVIFKRFYEEDGELLIEDKYKFMNIDGGVSKRLVDVSSFYRHKEESYQILDINNDGKDDIVVNRLHSNHGEDWDNYRYGTTRKVYMGNGTTEFDLSTEYEASRFHRFVDVNKDGLLDRLYANENHYVDEFWEDDYWPNGILYKDDRYLHHKHRPHSEVALNTGFKWEVTDKYQLPGGIFIYDDRAHEDGFVYDVIEDDVIKGNTKYVEADLSNDKFICNENVYEAGVVFLDLNGDGHQDMIKCRGSVDIEGKTSDETESRSPINEVHLWTKGAGWINAPQYKLPINGDSYPRLDPYIDTDPNADIEYLTKFIDLNADGLIDIAVGGEAYFNTGAGWIESYEGSYDLPYVDIGVRDEGIKFVDINGDNLTDVMIGTPYLNGPETWLNTGSGWKKHEGFKAPHEFYLPYTIWKDSDEYEWEEPEVLSVGVVFSDVNGDGVPELHYGYSIDHSDLENTYVSMSYTTRYNAMTLLEITNEVTGTSTKLGYELVKKTNGNNINCLSKIDIGHEILDKKLRNGERVTTTISYANPIYDYYNAEFRGFQTVTTKSEDRIGDETHWDITQTTYDNNRYTEVDGVKHYDQYIKNMVKSVETFRDIETATGERNVVSTGKSVNTNVAIEFPEVSYKYVYPFLVKSCIYNDEGEKIAIGFTSISEYTYDANNLPVQVKNYSLGDPLSPDDDVLSTTTFRNDVSNWLLQPTKTEIKDNSGKLLNKSETEYDGVYPVRIHSYPVDKNGNVGAKLTTTVEYGNYGLPVKTTSPTGQTSEISYEYNSGNYSVITTTRDAMGLESKAKIDKYGRLAESVDAFDDVTQYSYDEYGRVTSVKETVYGALKETSKHRYFTQQTEKFGKIWVTESSMFDDRHDNNQFVVRMLKDALGRTIQTQGRTWIDGGLKWVTSGWIDRDDMGRAIKSGLTTEYSGPGTSVGAVAVFDDNETTSLANATKYSYDHYGRVDTVVAPRSEGDYTVTLSYGIARDPNSPRILSEVHKVASWNDGVKEEIRESKEFTDLAGQTVISRVLAGTDAAPEWYETTFEYDLDGTTILTEPTGITGKTFSSSFGMDSMITPDAGKLVYTYDDCGRLVKSTHYGLDLTPDDVDSYKETIYEYDQYDRIKDILYNNVGIADGMVSDNVHYTYYGINESGANRYRKGAIKSLTKGSYSVVYDYGEDWLSVAKTIDGKTYETKYNYDLNGRSKSIELPDEAGVIGYDYNKGGNLTRVFKGGQDYISEIKYTKDGQRAEFTYGNGEVTKYTYDPLSLLLETMEVGNKIDYTYNFASNGLLTNITDNAGVGVASSQTYEYDNWGRIKKGNGTAGDQSYTQSYAFDGSNRMLKKTLTSGAVYNYDYHDNSHAVKAITVVDPENKLTGINFSYDDFGNMTQKQSVNGTSVVHGQTYKYDTENRIREMGLAGGKTAKYQYSADGGRIVKQLLNSDGTVTNKDIYVNGSYTIKSAAGVITPAIHVSDGVNIFATIPNKNDAEIKYYTQNNIGSTIMLTDAKGTELHRYLYKPFGEMFVDEDLVDGEEHDVDRKFTGQMMDDESDLYYMNARYYDPETGVFLRPDPAMDGVNHYGYVSGNPISYTDPTGMYEEYYQGTYYDWNGEYWIPQNYHPGFDEFYDQTFCGEYYQEPGYNFYEDSQYFMTWDGTASTYEDRVNEQIAYNVAAPVDHLYMTTTGSDKGLVNQNTFLEGDKNDLAEQVFNEFQFTVLGYGLSLGSPNVSNSGKGMLLDDVVNVVDDVVIGGCFSEGTIVLTEAGKIPIEDIEVGTLVFSLHDEDGEQEFTGDLDSLSAEECGSLLIQ